MTYRLSLSTEVVVDEHSNILHLEINELSGKIVIPVECGSKQDKDLRVLLANSVRKDVNEKQYEGILSDIIPSPKEELTLSSSDSISTVHESINPTPNFDYSRSHLVNFEVSRFYDWINLGTNSLSTKCHWEADMLNDKGRYEVLNVSQQLTLPEIMSSSYDINSEVLVMKSLLRHHEKWKEEMKLVIVTMKPDIYDSSNASYEALTPGELLMKKNQSKYLYANNSRNFRNTFLLIDQTISHQMMRENQRGDSHVQNQIQSLMAQWSVLSLEKNMKIILWHDYAFNFPVFNEISPSCRLFITDHTNYDGRNSKKSKLVLKKGEALLQNYIGLQETRMTLFGAEN